MLKASARICLRRQTCNFIRSCHRSRPIRFGIGDIIQDSKVPNRMELVPTMFTRDPFLETLEARDHMRWLMQKDALGQDMLFMGGIVSKSCGNL